MSHPSEGRGPCSAASALPGREARPTPSGAWGGRHLDRQEAAGHRWWAGGTESATAVWMSRLRGREARYQLPGRGVSSCLKKRSTEAEGQHYKDGPEPRLACQSASTSTVLPFLLKR